MRLPVDTSRARRDSWRGFFNRDVDDWHMTQVAAGTSDSRVKFYWRTVRDLFRSHSTFESAGAPSREGPCERRRAVVSANDACSSSNALKRASSANFIDSSSMNFTESNAVKQFTLDVIDEFSAILHIRFIRCSGRREQRRGRGPHARQLEQFRAWSCFITKRQIFQMAQGDLDLWRQWTWQVHVSQHSSIDCNRRCFPCGGSGHRGRNSS